MSPTELVAQVKADIKLFESTTQDNVLALVALVEKQLTPYMYLSEVMKEDDKNFMSLIIRQLDLVQHTIHKALDDDYEKLSMKRHKSIWMSGYVMVEHLVSMLEVVTGIHDAKVKGGEPLESDNNPS